VDGEFSSIWGSAAAEASRPPPETATMSAIASEIRFMSFTPSCPLRDYDRITWLKEHVLLPFAAYRIVVVETDFLCSVFARTENRDALAVGIGAESARLCNKLENIDGADEWVAARFAHLPQDVDQPAADIHRAYRDLGIHDVVSQLCGKYLCKLVWCHSSHVDITQKGQRDKPVGPDRHRLREIGIFPDSDMNDVGGAEHE